jgi:hypothetical protein
LASSTTPADTRAPVIVNLIGSGCSAPSKSTRPATKLTAGSVIVIAVSAVGSEPLENASCASSPPVSVVTGMQDRGQLRFGRSSVARTTSMAVPQKQTPAAIATRAARS